MLSRGTQAAHRHAACAPLSLFVCEGYCHRTDFGACGFFGGKRSAQIKGRAARRRLPGLRAHGADKIQLRRGKSAGNIVIFRIGRIAELYRYAGIGMIGVADFVCAFLAAPLGGRHIVVLMRLRVLFALESVGIRKFHTAPGDVDAVNRFRSTPAT